MAIPAGSFMWHELAARDPEAAARFYGQVAGWRTEPMHGVDGVPYRRIVTNGAGIGGIRRLGEAEAAEDLPPRWTGYVLVPDVDAAAAAAERAGGRVWLSPRDVPGLVRFAVLADPEGAEIVVARPLTPEDAEAEPPQSGPGHVVWNELRARDWEKSFAFHAGLFGWTKGRAMPMGAAGAYQMFDVAGRPVGAMMNGVPDGRPPAWFFYVAVEDIDAGVARVTAAGGRVASEPQPIPGDAFAAECADPEGAPFGLVGARAR